jgi:beta-lactamase family protein
MTFAGRPRHALRAGLVAALVVLVAPRPVTLGPRTTGNDELAERLRHMTGGHGHLGLAVGLVDGATVQAAGVGLHGGDPDTAVTADTSFEIGSVTTVFNGMLLADMVADGRITPETTLRELYPGTRFADRGRWDHAGRACQPPGGPARRGPRWATGPAACRARQLDRRRFSGVRLTHWGGSWSSARPRREGSPFPPGRVVDSMRLAEESRLDQEDTSIQSC